MVHTWDKYYVKHDKHDVELVKIFLPGSEGTGKYHNIQRCIQVIPKSLL